MYLITKMIRILIKKVILIQIKNFKTNIINNFNKTYKINNFNKTYKIRIFNKVNKIKIFNKVNKINNFNKIKINYFNKIN